MPFSPHEEFSVSGTRRHRAGEESCVGEETRVLAAAGDEAQREKRHRRCYKSQRRNKIEQREKQEPDVCRDK